MCDDNSESLEQTLHDLKFSIPVFLAKVSSKKLTPSKYFTLHFFMFMLTLQQLKWQHSQTWHWKQPGKYNYQNSSTEESEKVNRYTKSSFKASLATQAATVFPPLGLAALTQCTTSGQHTVRSPSTVHGAHHEYLNLKEFHSYSFKDCTYFLMKIYIQICSLIFLKISGRSVVLQPFWTKHPRT